MSAAEDCAVVQTAEDACTICSAAYEQRIAELRRQIAEGREVLVDAAQWLRTGRHLEAADSILMALDLLDPEQVLPATPLRSAATTPSEKGGGDV